MALEDIGAELGARDRSKYFIKLYVDQSNASAADHWVGGGIADAVGPAAVNSVAMGGTTADLMRGWRGTTGATTGVVAGDVIGMHAQGLSMLGYNGTYSGGFPVFSAMTNQGRLGIAINFAVAGEFGEDVDLVLFVASDFAGVIRRVQVQVADVGEPA